MVSARPFRRLRAKSGRKSWPSPTCWRPMANRPASWPAESIRILWFRVAQAAVGPRSASCSRSMASASTSSPPSLPAGPSGCRWLPRLARWTSPMRFRSPDLTSPPSLRGRCRPRSSWPTVRVSSSAVCWTTRSPRPSTRYLFWGTFLSSAGSSSLSRGTRRTPS